MHPEIGLGDEDAGRASVPVHLDADVAGPLPQVRLRLEFDLGTVEDFGKAVLVVVRLAKLQVEFRGALRRHRGEPAHLGMPPRGRWRACTSGTGSPKLPFFSCTLSIWPILPMGSGAVTLVGTQAAIRPPFASTGTCAVQPLAPVGVNGMVRPDDAGTGARGRATPRPRFGERKFLTSWVSARSRTVRATAGAFPRRANGPCTHLS